MSFFDSEEDPFAFIEDDEGPHTICPEMGLRNDDSGQMDWPEPPEATEQPASSSTDPNPGGNWIRNLINRIPETYRNMIDSTPIFHRTLGLEIETLPTDSLTELQGEPIRIGRDTKKETRYKQARKEWPHLWMKTKFSCGWGPCAHFVGFFVFSSKH